MKKIIRNNVFETNSSSCHTITMNKEIGAEPIEDKLTVDSEDNKVHISLGEFGWGYEEYNDAETKLSYLLTMVACTNSFSQWGKHTYDEWEEFYNLEDFKMVEDAVKEKMNCKGIVITNLNGCYYVDHQSQQYIGTLKSGLEDCGYSLSDFIFDTGVTLIIDNDNH